MIERRGARAAAALLALLAWAALLLQLHLTLGATHARGGSTGEALLLYSGYFTILSNLFVALCASAQAWAPRSRLAGAAWRGCATTAIVLVGLGYHLLLRDIWDPQGWQRIADNLLHYAVPAAALGHWLWYRPSMPLPAWQPLLWALYPAAYFAYAMVRGEWLGQYPYPFVDVTALGHARVFANAGILLLAYLAVGALLRWQASRR